MTWATFPFFFLFLSLLAVGGECGVKCTVEKYNPCKCTLSNGYRGTVDLTRIFEDGSLISQHDGLFYVRIHSCNSQPYQAALWLDNESKPSFTYGHVANLSREWEITLFRPELDRFEFLLSYAIYRDYYPLNVTYTYDPSVDHELTALNLDTNPGTFLELKVVSRYVKPLLLPQSDTVGPYSIEHDVCARWHQERPLLDQVGLLGLAAPVIGLNSTNNMFHHTHSLGICVNPIRDFDTSDDCCAVRRTSSLNVGQCIGRSAGAQLMDQRDQGWMMLRYPSGDFIEECREYAVTEILFTCDHRDQTLHTPSPMYPENDFIFQCRYQFIWPTHLACPNLTSPSGGSPSSLNPSSILLGMSGSVLVLLLLITAGVSISTCYLCRRERTRRSVDLNENTSNTFSAASNAPEDWTGDNKDC